MKEPDVRPLSNGKDWILIENFIDGKTRIPKGFTFDFGTIPRPFWPMIGSPATGKHRTPSFKHDWRSAINEPWDKSAKIFLDDLKLYGVGFVKRHTMYYIVKLHGNFRSLDPRESRLRRLYKKTFGDNL